MVKKLIDIVTKARIDAAKTASKRVVQKTAETTGDLTGIKIADKIISVGKTKSNKKEDRQEIYILHKKDLIMIYVLTPYKNGISKNYKPTRYNIW